MSDSVDRVFVHALATVRRLPRTGSSRPPPTSRLRLYGLYKQSMEGDVQSILARPTLPVNSPDLNNPNANTSNTVHRYASRDLRTREAQAEIEKWDAWHACAGMSRTEAKRQYISTLIDTMKEYASGTSESRELVSELEFVWGQIREQSGSEPEPEERSLSGSRGEKESPTRKLERAGMGIGRSQSGLGSMDFDSKRPSIGSSGGVGGVGGLGLNQTMQERGTQKRLKRTESGLRVLSPVSQGDSDSVIEPVDAEEEDDQNLDTAPTSPFAQRSQRDPTNLLPPPHDIDPTSPLATWQRDLESHLHALKTEIAALREQLSANHLLSSSTYSVGAAYYTLSTRQKILHRAKLYIRTYTVFFCRQLLVQFGILALVLAWGRFQGDLRAEEWVRAAAVRIKKRIRGAFGGVALWLLDLFGRDGRLRTLGRVLRLS